MSGQSLSPMRSRRQDRFILALLEHPTLEKAAAAAGVSDVTLRYGAVYSGPNSRRLTARPGATPFLNRSRGCSTPRTQRSARCCAS